MHEHVSNRTDNKWTIDACEAWFDWATNRQNWTMDNQDTSSRTALHDRTHYSTLEAGGLAALPLGIDSNEADEHPISFQLYRNYPKIRKSKNRV